MKSNSSLAYLDPVYLLESGDVVEGMVSIQDLRKSKEELDADLLSELNNGRKCKYSLSAKLGEYSKICVQGALSVELVLDCQRCLGNVVYNLQQNFCVYPVEQNKVSELPKHLEPLILSNRGDFEVNELLADELVLSIPFAAKHETC